MMTFAELKAAVLSTVGGDFTADVARYLNKGLKELSADCSVIGRATVTVANGAFALPADCLYAKDVFYNDMLLRPYERTNIPETLTGLPFYWFRDGGNIKLYPSPSAGEGTTQLTYIKRQAIMEAEADTHTLDDADDFLIAFAKWKVIVDTRGLTDEAAYWKREAEEERQKWLELNRKQHPRVRKVRVGRWF